MITLAVASGKGGVGKSALASSLGIGLSQRGRKTVLFDADLALANVDVLLGLKSEFTLQHVLNDQATLKQALHEGPEGLKVLTGASGVSSLVQAGAKRLAKLLSQLAAIERETDFLIFDVGAGVDRKVLAFTQPADVVVAIVTPDPASITDGYALMKTQFRRRPDSQVWVVVNQATSESEGAHVFRSLDAIAQKFLKHSLHYAGTVRSDRELGTAVRSRQPLRPFGGAGEAMEDVRRLVTKFEELREAPGGDFCGRFAAYLDAA